MRVYIDDIIIYFRTLNEHINYLKRLFTLCRVKRISLSFAKLFLDYSFIVLLKQRVNSLKLLTSKEKIAAIISLSFLYSLKKLKIFLNMTN